MEDNRLDFEDKLHINLWFESEEGKKFLEAIKEIHSNHLDVAQTMYLKLANPNEQISAQVNQAAGIKEILDYIDTISLEVKERKKEVKEQPEA